jgi:hypothetical protein
VPADFHAWVEYRVMVREERGDRLRPESAGDGVAHQSRVKAAAFDRRSQVLGHDSGFRHSSILPCPEAWFTPVPPESAADLVFRTVKGGDISRYGLVLSWHAPVRLVDPSRIAA